jgi:hypothetical protein
MIKIINLTPPAIRIEGAPDMVTENNFLGTDSLLLLDEGPKEKIYLNRFAILKTNIESIEGGSRDLDQEAIEAMTLLELSEFLIKEGFCMAQIEGEPQLRSVLSQELVTGVSKDFENFNKLEVEIVSGTVDIIVNGESITFPIASTGDDINKVSYVPTTGSKNLIAVDATSGSAFVVMDKSV